MGNRANILVKNDDVDGGVYLYTHWRADELPCDLKTALSRRLRWDDAVYLTRIIFDAMTEGRHGEEVGYGISTFPPDGENRVLTVNCEKQTVSFSGQPWTFEKFSQLTEPELREVWKNRKL